MSSKTDILSDQSCLWRSKVSAGLGSPESVGSESFHHKQLRYEQIWKLIQEVSGDTGFSVLDVGCGTGDFYQYLSRICSVDQFSYLGIDIVDEYICFAQEKYERSLFQTTEGGGLPESKFDYVVFSGIFHQIGNSSEEQWWNYMKWMLNEGFLRSKKAVIFNFLNTDVSFRKTGNYYADTIDVISFCRGNLSRYMSFRQLIPLYETTLCVYRSSYIKELFKGSTFERYTYNETS